MANPARLLGFAFANADFLFETDNTGKILFAAGAARDLVREPADKWVGKSADNLFAAASRDNFRRISSELGTGHRSGPHSLTLATGIAANIAMFRLPENASNISYTLARAAADTGPDSDSQTGIASREDFLETAAASDPSSALSLLEIPGLPALCSKLSADDAASLIKRIGTNLLESGASNAGRISETTFGTLSAATLGDLQLTQKVGAAFAEIGVSAPQMAEARLSLQGSGDLASEQRLLALRYVIDQFAENKKIDLPRGDVGAAFAQMIDQTQMRLTAMTRTLDEGAFEIAYQPIKDLTSGKLSHYEALARFNNPEGTGETVKFIEQLGVANSFDLAVANKVLSVIEQRTDVQIAFNVSGATIASPSSFGLLAGLLAKRRALAPRTLIEITETVGIRDLDSVAKAIDALRAMGYRVGLDYFGAGAASINYLHAFHVDFVKFDGGLIKKMGRSAREDSLLKGLAKLCLDLNVVTIAEWIESDQMAKAARAMGFHHGQGKWLGAPMLDMPRENALNARRAGIKESWG